MINIVEKFISIQGEGYDAGKPSTFIRISGCNLKCPYCDSKHAHKVTNKCEIIDESSLFKLIDYVKSGPEDIIITGGEPLLYSKDNVFKMFLNSILKEHKKVSFETTFLYDVNDIMNGSLIQTWSDLREEWTGMFNQCKFVVSPKLTLASYDNNDISYSDIIRYYTVSDKSVLITMTYNKQIYYKLLYTKLTETPLLNLIKKFPEDWINEFVSIMPMTEIPFKNDFKSYRKSCSDTIKFCIKNKLRYSPRIHIDVYGDMKGV